MSKVLVTEQYLTDIANAIRTKRTEAGVLNYKQYTPAQMANGIISLPSSSNLQQNKTIIPSANTQVVSADTGYDGLLQVTVNGVNSTSTTINSNGTYVPPAGSFYSEVIVDINDSNVRLQNKTATPSTIPQSIIPDQDYSGLSSVYIEPIPSNYADISQTTATQNDVLTGKSFYNEDGVFTQGLLTVNSYYIGTTEPNAALGQDGDLYLKI